MAQLWVVNKAIPGVTHLCENKIFNSRVPIAPMCVGGGVPIAPVCSSGGGLLVVWSHGLLQGVWGDGSLGNDMYPTFPQSGARVCFAVLAPAGRGGQCLDTALSGLHSAGRSGGWAVLQMSFAGLPGGPAASWAAGKLCQPAWGPAAGFANKLWGNCLKIWSQTHARSCVSKY